MKDGVKLVLVLIWMVFIASLINGYIQFNRWLSVWGNIPEMQITYYANLESGIILTVPLIIGIIAIVATIITAVSEWV